MNKLDEKYQSLILSPVSQADLKPVRRLIVLVPSLEFDLASVTRRVWELANAMAADVLFLGLYGDAAQESSLRRELITLSALVKDDRISAEAEVVFSKDWVNIVKTRFQAGDMVVCFAEQSIGLARKPLSQILQSDLNLPLYILSNLYPQNDPRPNWLVQITAWVGSIVIILGFLMLQVKISTLAQDWSYSLLMFLSILFEIWMIWVWNSLLG